MGNNDNNNRRKKKNKTLKQGRGREKKMKEEEEEEEEEESISASSMSSSSSSSKDHGNSNITRKRNQTGGISNNNNTSNINKKSNNNKNSKIVQEDEEKGREINKHRKRSTDNKPTEDQLMSGLTNKERATFQMNEQFKRNAQMAKKRLAFLLKQSDVFAHFVAGNAKKQKIVKSLAHNTSSSSSSAFSHEGGLSSPHKKSEKEEDAALLRDALLSDHEEDEPSELEVDDGVGTEYVSITKTPPFINGQMRDYQLEGLTWMVNLQSQGMGGILADEMGLGKTLQSISLLGYMYHCRGVTGPHFVICPKSTLSNWVREIERWCPSLRTIKLLGDPEERGEVISEHLVPGRSAKERTFDVLVTSYEMVLVEKAALMKIPWVYLVLDEAHRVKNEESKLAEVLRKMCVQHRLLLTGTPLQNNMHELWALLNFLLPEIFSSSDHFDEWFDLGSGDDDKKQDVVSKLHRILKPFMLRRLKKDVAKTLPPKTETLLFVGMSELQREIYRRILERDMETLLRSFQGDVVEPMEEVLGSRRSSSNQNGNTESKKAVKGTQDKVKLLNIVMQLRKVTNHPYLFNGVEDRSLDPLGDHLIMNCGKLVLLDKLLPKLKAQGSRVLIFSQMTRLLDILEDYCTVRHYSYCRIDGQTSYDEREEAINSFNAPNSQKFVFLLSTRAGGLGINLATADTVILYDSDWNPQVDLQAQDRAHRIGQTKPVHVYRLVTEDTVEEKIIERAEAKLRLDAVIIQQGRLVEQHKKGPSKEEMMALIRFGAEKVFRSTDSTITDDDIDAIICRGEQKTRDINSKLQAYENIRKGDGNSGILDFKLDGPMQGMQEFNGVDYKSISQATIAAKASKSSSAADALSFLQSISEAPRKRNRTRVIAYSDLYGERPSRGGGGGSGGDKSVDFSYDDEDDESTNWGEDTTRLEQEAAVRAKNAANRVTIAVENAMTRDIAIPRLLRVNKFESYQLYPEEEIFALNRKEIRRYIRWRREKWLAEIEVKVMSQKSATPIVPAPTTSSSSSSTVVITTNEKTKTEDENAARIEENPIKKDDEEENGDEEEEYDDEEDDDDDNDEDEDEGNNNNNNEEEEAVDDNKIKNNLVDTASTKETETVSMASVDSKTMNNTGSVNRKRKHQTVKTEKVKKRKRKHKSAKQRRLEIAQKIRDAAIEAFQISAKKARQELAVNDAEDNAFGWTLPALEVSGFDESEISSEGDEDYEDEDSQQGKKGTASNPKSYAASAVAGANTKHSNLPQLLSKQEEAEKARLWSMGFPNWERHEYRTFLRACARFGPSDIESIQKDLRKKTIEEVRKYKEAIFARGEKHLSPEEWAKFSDLVDRGNVRAKDLDERIGAILRKLEACPDPRNNLTFLRSNPGNDFTIEEDRELCLALRDVGWGKWDLIANGIRQSPRFMFDYFFLSANEADISKRCDLLTRIAKRDEKVALKKDEKATKMEEIRIKKDEEDAARELEVTNALNAYSSTISKRWHELLDQELEWLDKFTKIAKAREEDKMKRVDSKQGESSLPS